MLKQFIYFILDAAGRSYFLDSRGDVKNQSMPKPIRSTPDGWQSKSLKWGRNLDYFGVVRTFTTPLKFVRDGAKILRQLAYTMGFQAFATLAIGRLELDGPDAGIYKKYYVGTLDFSNWSDKQPDSATLNVMDGGLAEMVKAFEDTTYEIPLDGRLTINMSGIALQQSTTSLVSGYSAGGYTYGSLLPESTILSSEGDKLGTLVRSTSYHATAGDNNAAVVATNDPGFKADVQAPVVVTCDFSFKTAFDTVTQPNPHDPSMVLKVDFRVFNAGVLQQSVNIYSSTDFGTYFGTSPAPPRLILATHNITGVYTLNLNVDDEVYVYIYATPYVSVSPSIYEGSRHLQVYFFDPDDTTYQPGTISWRFSIEYPETETFAIRPLDLFTELINRMAGDTTYNVVSSLFSGEAFDYPATSGDAIRGISGAVLKTSFKDFFKSYNTRFNIAFAISGDGQTARIEPKGFVFDESTTITDLGEVQGLEIVPATDFLFNTVKIGWPAQNYDDLNGRDEFNTTQLYTTPITRVVKELDLTSVYRADAYGIEYLRINLDGKTTTDSSSDNDVFIINTHDRRIGSGDFFITITELNRPVFDSITGVLSPSTIFNVLLSPKRCLLAHGNYVNICLYNVAGYLVYQTTDKNSNLSTTKNGVTITESANVAIDTLPPALCSQWRLNFNSRVPYALATLIGNNPYGKVTFTFNNAPYAGFIAQMSQQPAFNNSQAFQLFGVIDNDYKPLIHA